VREIKTLPILFMGYGVLYLVVSILFYGRLSLNSQVSGDVSFRSIPADSLIHPVPRSG